jgi:DNA transformation protein
MAYEELREHCLELLQPLGQVRARRMFGGHGLYVDDLFVAIIANDCLYLKTDSSTHPTFEAAGCQAFVYDRQRQAVSLGYWTAPPDAMESPALMAPWARLAIQAALRARVGKAAAKSVKPRAAKAAAPATKAASRRSR